MAELATTFTPADLAEQWKCSPDQIRALIADGELEATNIGRGSRRARWIIRQESVEAFLSRRANRKTPKPRHRKPAIPQSVREWV